MRRDRARRDEEDRSISGRKLFASVALRRLHPSRMPRPLELARAVLGLPLPRLAFCRRRNRFERPGRRAARQAGVRPSEGRAERGEWSELIYDRCGGEDNHEH